MYRVYAGIKIHGLDVVGVARNYVQCKDESVMFLLKGRNGQKRSGVKISSAGSDFPPLEAGKLRLYSMRFCPFAERTRLVLAHKKIPHETVNINLKEKPEWFFEKNPLGLVPVLEKDGKIVYESSITCDYLDELYPDNKLLSSDPYQRALDKIIVELFSKTFMDTMKLFRSKGEDKDALASYREKMKPIEKALSERGDYFGGDKVGMVDLIFWPWFERIPAQQKITNLDQLPNDMFPKLNAWRTRMLEVEAVKETICDPETQYQFYMSNAEGTGAGLDQGMELWNQIMAH